MNAYTTRGQARIQPRDIAAVIHAYPLVGASLTALERQRGCQAEAEVDWLLKQNGGTPKVAASRVSRLRTAIAATLVRAGERLAGLPRGGVMGARASTIPLSLALSAWWLPLLGLLLAGLGVGLLTGAVGDLVAPVRATRSIAGAMVADESIAGRAVLTAPLGRGIGAGAAGAVNIGPGRLDRPVNCLGADLATGRRAESAHLATVPLQRRADCGDARDAILGLAALPHTVPPPASVPSSWSHVATPQSDGIDLVAAALYGPPDRQPPAKHKEGVVRDGGRGRARDYLEQTAASRVLRP